MFILGVHQFEHLIRDVDVLLVEKHQQLRILVAAHARQVLAQDQIIALLRAEVPYGRKHVLIYLLGVQLALAVDLLRGGFLADLDLDFAFVQGIRKLLLLLQ